jgi:pSer/pThr/pTyr-binding forkhead associated (FHA) protein
MRAALHITSGPYTGRRFSVRDGQIAQFGRTEWADVSFPQDATMSDLHFSIDSRGKQCLVRDLQSAGGTFVDGEPITQVALQTGMSISAGATSFVVVLGDDVWPVAQAEGDGHLQTAVSPQSPLCQLAVQASLSEPAVAFINDEHTVADFIAVLWQQHLHDDAFRLLAFGLSKPQAIAWACHCLRLLVSKFGQPKLAAADEAALALAERWAAKPSDELGWEAEAVASALKHQTPAAWVAVAAHYSGSSLAPPDSEPVPPPSGLSTSSICTALLLALARLSPAIASAAREEFLRLGLAELKSTSA